MLIALHLVPSLGPIRIARLVQAIGSPCGARAEREKALAAVSGIGPALRPRSSGGEGRSTSTRNFARASRVGVRLLTWLDADHPERLHELGDAPPVLYVRGVSGAPGPAVAVVGTRRPSGYRLDVAGALGEAFDGAGVVVLSGLARGIDAAAQAGALRLGGRPVGVLGAGWISWIRGSTAL